MAENNNNKETEAKPASVADISLSQVLLAPLDAIFKAQIHAARSFINMLLQLGYKHQSVDEKGNATGETNADNLYMMEFDYPISNRYESISYYSQKKWNSSQLLVCGCNLTARRVEGTLRGSPIYLEFNSNTLLIRLLKSQKKRIVLTKVWT